MNRLRLLSFVFLIAACGSSSTSSGPTSDQACTDVAMARCQKRSTCTNATGITRIYGDMATCLTREKLSCTAGLSAPSTANTPAATEACATAITASSCADFLGNNTPDACIITGPKAQGAGCAFAAQCATTFCGGDKTATCGTCAALPSAGDSCANGFCGRGMECVSSTQLCQAFAAVGDSCGAGMPCAPDVACAMGTCTATVATVGSSCSATMPCDGTMGLRCAGMPGAKTCVAISYVGDGAACGALADGFVGCAGGGICYTSAGTEAGSGDMGTCKAAAADGAACDVMSGPPCLTPARCIVSGNGTSGTCTIATGSCT